MKVERHRHILVVGGSGMLAEVSRHFALRCETISVIGRSLPKLEHLFKGRRFTGIKSNLIPVDYKREGRLKGELTGAIDNYGPIEIAVGWIHDTAAKAPGLIMDLMQEQGILSRYFEIAGSGDQDILKTKITIPDRIDVENNVLYRKVVLGYRGFGKKKRWLTHEEICGGVIDAVASDRELTIVGELGLPAQ